MLARRLLLAVSGGGGSFTPPEEEMFHGVRAFGTTQSLTSGGYTTVALNATDYDTDSYHDDVTDNSRLTVPAGLGGKYHIFAAVSIEGNATGQRLMIVTLNESGAVDGSTVILVPVSDSGPGSAGNAHLAVNTVRALNDGDFIELRIYQNAGVTLSLDIGSNPGDYVPSLGMHRVGQ